MPLQIRNVAQWICNHFPEPLAKNVLNTTDTVRNELIASFKMYSEVQDISKELLTKYGHPNTNTAFVRFQAYLRQAITFFEAAELLHYRASSLLYYYSYMNFAKAIIFLFNPSFTAGHIHHGLKPHNTTFNLRNHFVSIKAPGIFPDFYKSFTKKSILPNTKLPIITLLSYVRDIAFEYSNFNLGRPRTFASRYAIVRYHHEQEFRGIIAANYFLEPEEKKFQKILSTKHDEITLTEDSRRTLFGFDAATARCMRFWETKKKYGVVNGGPPAKLIVNDCVRNLSGFLCRNPFSDETNFTLNLKMHTPKHVIMNEVLAIYAITFYLGSLVRYRPDVLESMLAAKEAWLIERFIKTTPLTLLRHIRNMIDTNYIAYTLRM